MKNKQLEGNCVIDAWFRDFWGMKREVAHFVLKCFWFQQMKAKHRSPRLLQKIIESITMYFVMRVRVVMMQYGLSRTS